MIGAVVVSLRSIRKRIALRRFDDRGANNAAHDFGSADQLLAQRFRVGVDVGPAPELCALDAEFGQAIAYPTFLSPRRRAPSASGSSPSRISSLRRLRRAREKLSRRAWRPLLFAARSDIFAHRRSPFELRIHAFQFVLRGKYPSTRHLPRRRQIDRRRRSRLRYGPTRPLHALG